MRISTLGTGAALFFVSLAPAQILFNSPHFFAATTPGIPATPLSINATPLRAITAAPRTDDDQKQWAGANVALEEKPFLVDYANFAAQPNQTFVEFYVQIGYDRLSFIRDGKSYQAIYDIDLYIEDQQGSLVQTLSTWNEVRVDHYDETTSPNKHRLTLLSTYLCPGNYQWRAIITDKETGKNYEIREKFSARDFSDSRLTLSDLQFSRNIQVDSSTSAFVKHNRWIEPNVPHVYGQYAGQLFVYYEIYNLADPAFAKNSATPDSAIIATAASDSFRTLYVICNSGGEVVKELWKFTRKPGTSCVQSVLLPIADLKSGPYTLTVRVFDGASYAEATGRFSMQWDLFTFKDKKFEEVLAQMHYAGRADELKRLAQLPETDRQRGLFEFWQRRDPTPGTSRNEAMEEYYRRINYANTHFKWIGGEGWKSPQGQIYLMYGQPDRLHRFARLPFGPNRDELMPSVWSADGRQELPAAGLAEFNKPCEIWEYTQLNRSFVFVDSRGVGMFELVDPISAGAVGLR